MGATTYQAAQLETLWVQAGGSQQTAPIASSIALAESGGDPNIVSPSNDWGLWQIHNGGSALLSPLANAQRAVQMSNNGTDWHRWCTAYSDAACGTKGGTYEGAGSPYLRYLTGLTGTTPVSATLPAVSSTPAPSSSSDVLFRIPIPIPGVPDITFTHANGRAWAGAGALIAGALVLIVGLVVLATGAAPKVALGKVQAKASAAPAPEPVPEPAPEPARPKPGNALPALAA